MTDEDGQNGAGASARSRPSFPIVGIGASAGGLAAFESFFSGMPAGREPGMGFVLVQHLSPDHESLLPELVQRFTRMKVFEAKDGMPVLPNCVYIIPPGHDLAILGGALQLLVHATAQPRRPIDFFFRSLAQDLGELAIGIVLSGTGSDGTLGVRAIKAAGGMVMAQGSRSAQSHGMPSSAVAAGVVDYELRAEEMPARLLAFVTHSSRGPDARSGPEPSAALDKIFVLLRAQMGHDFSRYKPSTIGRRIARRMAVQHIEEIEGYVAYLQQSPAEVVALFNDLLIGVTSFFRDPEAFAALEHALPGLLADKPPGATVRLWSAACSTGEEAYSLAILVGEHVASVAQGYKVQIFATDIDGRAIAAARAGVYPASVVEHLSAERLARSFTLEPGGASYRIKRPLRDLVVFSEQDILQDPPFSRLDLVCCRNLLIYLDGELQRELVSRFAYALNPGGLLFLGTSETVGEAGLQFDTLDRKAKVFRRTQEGPTERQMKWDRFSRRASRVVAPSRAAPGATPTVREMCEAALLQHVVPASALVKCNGEVLFLHGRTGMYLEPPPGEVGVSNVLAMAREGLRAELGTALLLAAAGREPVSRFAVRVKTNGDFTDVDVTVHPVLGTGAEPDVPLFLVTFAAARPRDGAAPPQTSGDSDEETAARIAFLEHELSAQEDTLRATTQELGTANDDLKSSNEEMQSVNEELQSANEELETSKEELQATNEELHSVNGELQARLVELSRTSDDMSNLLAGTGIGTLFVDRQLRILRFTPSITRIINLIPADVGRPVAHLVSNLVGYVDLVADTQAVLDTLMPRDVDVQAKDGRWFAMRIIPYRTLANVIKGAVLTFVDITETVLVKESLRKVNALTRLAVVVRDAHDPITVHDLSGRILAWNRAAERVYGWTEAEALAMNVRDCIPEALRDEAVAKVRELSSADGLAPLKTSRLTRTGAVVEVTLISTPLLDETGRTYAIATTERATSPAADRGESRRS